MKICSVNVNESYLDAIKKLVGKDSLYPSRSELVRCAVREFLIKELQLLYGIQKQNETENHIESNVVKIPNENGFKIYKILRKLE